MRRYFFIFILFFLTGCNSNEQSKFEKPHVKKETAAVTTINPELHSVDELIQSELQKSGTPGATLIVVCNGKIIHAKGYGLSDVESHIKADVNTSWPLASITKVLTSIGVMQLVESGKVKLDEDVNTYLKRVRVPDSFPKPITVADLLRHTSGLDELPGRRFERPGDVSPFDKFLSTHLVRYRPPGEFTSYSSYGMSLAGLLIEEVSGSSYSSYLQTHLFEPLGMKSARVMTKSGDEKGVAAPYEIEDGKAKRINYEWYATPPVASAVMSASDMARLLIDLTSPNPKVISRNTLQHMVDTQATLHPAVPGWGYGFQLDEFNQHRIAEHGGDIGGFAGLMSIVPDSRLGIYTVHHGEGSSIRFDVRNAILEKYFPGNPPAPVAIKNVDLKPYAGDYRASFQCHTCGSEAPPVPEFEVSINDDGTLGLWGSRWIPIAEDLFSREDGRARLAFVRDSKSKVVALSGGSWRVGERVK
ncbi:MAG TPA: serine hydrolase domain-containing protein [Acidobacteriota bacterium]|nr:serine hydrolase domain-containing protein [Acidobacteriota bacterium]